MMLARGRGNARKALGEGTPGLLSQQPTTNRQKNHGGRTEGRSSRFRITIWLQLLSRADTTFSLSVAIMSIAISIKWIAASFFAEGRGGGRRDMGALPGYSAMCRLCPSPRKPAFAKLKWRSCMASKTATRSRRARPSECSRCCSTSVRLGADLLRPAGAASPLGSIPNRRKN